MRNSRSFWSLLLRLSVSVVCIIILLKVVDFREAFRIAVELSPWWFVSGVVFALGSRYLMAYQNSVLFHHFNTPLSTFHVFLVTLAAAFYALFLPGDLGPSAIKIYRLGRKSSSFAKAVVSVVAARMVTIATVVTFGAIGLALHHPPELDAVVVPAVCVMGALFVAYVILFNRKAAGRTRAWADAADGRTGLRWEILAKVWRGAAVCQELPHGIQARLVLGAVGSFFLLVVAQYCFLRSLEVRLSPIAITWISSAILLVRLIPISISGLGIREGLVVFFLSGFGIGGETALGFGMVVFAAIVLIGLIGGLVELGGIFLGNRQVAS